MVNLRLILHFCLPFSNPRVPVKNSSEHPSRDIGTHDLWIGFVPACEIGGRVGFYTLPIPKLLILYFITIGYHIL